MGDDSNKFVDSDRESTLSRSSTAKTDEPLYQDEEWLRERYVDAGMTMAEIASEVGCQPNTVRRWIHRRGIDTRPPGRQPEANDANYEKVCATAARDDLPRTDETVLRRLYWEKGWSLTDIADEWDVAAETVRRWMNDCDIETRPGPQDEPESYRWTSEGLTYDPDRVDDEEDEDDDVDWTLLMDGEW